ncbi:peptide-methionine (S)-S-oxide reductase MsrA (plasmid) [Rhizobium sp. CB3171]|uniref:peptide-methionine (S)-S-oxide reductase MsrA n=1 Tax=unclassified Rhizobium TaxID=2613769 RepID=UPI000CDF356D|nr:MULTISPECIES: peptide-methionine (S)-S-oxide reductase MsrA [Rhizobium]AVA24460.1 peptide methionine sulfoxide reductase MsrA 3 [Rhizobium sp. NXC24]UWU25381.1 peptide-methionine (S)-S-oxide reductase MsrA [Rhizobium tropici]WFU06652.1 peptide-methionine (S)-S-oxide reductase MsrA [Rhizobium sp. CB3171]
MQMKTRSKSITRFGIVRPFLITGGLLGFLSAALLANSSAAEEPRLVPPAIHDVADTTSQQTAVFAGGCFWGMQGVFQHVDGVISATSGYAGGSAETANYEQTETGTTGHAEAVQIVFDPKKISYGKLLQIYFSVAHDPTQIDRQGPDSGTQYRSAIFPADAEQGKVASDYIAQLETAHVFKAKIATAVEPGNPFYKAEVYHQNYMTNNPGQLYIVINEQPKVDNLKNLFPQTYREKPVLVSDNQG